MPTSIQVHSNRVLAPWIAGLLPDNEQVLARWARRFQVSPTRSVLELHVGNCPEDFVPSTEDGCWDDCSVVFAVSLALTISMFVACIAMSRMWVCVCAAVTGVASLSAGPGVVAAVVAPDAVVSLPGVADSTPVADTDVLRSRVHGSAVRGIAVRKLSVSADARRVSARVSWDRQLLVAAGANRFRLRLVAFAGDGSARQVWSRVRVGAVPAKAVTARLTPANAKIVRSASETVLAVSQQHKRRNETKFSRAYATVVELPGVHGTARVQVARNVAQRDCRGLMIRRGANLRDCDLRAVNLRRSTLTRVDLRGAALNAAILTRSSVAGAQLSDAVVDGVKAHHLTGTPKSMPAGWTKRNGSLVPVPPTPTPLPVPTPSQTQKPQPAPTQTQKPEPAPTQTQKPEPAPTQTQQPQPVPSQT